MSKNTALLSLFVCLTLFTGIVAQNTPEKDEFGPNPDCANAGWDAQFAPRGTNEDIFSFAVIGTDIYVGGAFVTAGDKIANYIAKYDTVTGNWSSLGSGTNGTVLSVIAHGTDIYIGGGFTSAGGIPALNIAKYDTLTGTWSALGDGVFGQAVYSMLVFGDELYVGGNFTVAGPIASSHLARWNLTTNTWSSVGNVSTATFNPGVRAMAIHGDILYIGGGFSSVGGVAAANIAKWDGTLWSPLMAGSVNGLVDTVFALESDGANLFAGGRFFGTVARWDGSAFTFLNSPATINTLKMINGSLYAGGVAGFVGRWDGSAWQPLGSGIVTGTTGAHTFGVVGDDLYVGGRLREAGGIPVARVARWNLTTNQWSSLSPGNGLAGFFPSEVVAASGTDVYVGGAFLGAGDSQAAMITRFDTRTNSHSSLGAAANLAVRAIRPSGTDIYVGGEFTTIGGIAASRIAKYDTVTGTWSSLGSGIIGGSVPSVNSIAVKDGFVYVGGLFGSAGGVAASNVARYEIATGTWSALGSGTNFTVFALESSGDDILVGGQFSTAGGISSQGIARFSTSSNTWSGIGGGVHGSNPVVYTIAVGPAGDIFIGGSFDTAGIESVSNIARWDGLSWSSPGGGVSTTSSVVRSIVFKSGRLYATGFFDTAGGQPTKGIAVWDGVGWSSLGSGFGGDQQPRFATSLAVSGDSLYFAGDFISAGGKPSQWIARYRDSVATWTGAADDVWNNPLNWQDGAVPSATDRVIIPNTGVVNQPTVTAPVSVCSLTVRAGRNLNLASGDLLNVGSLLLLDGGNVTTGSGVPLSILPGVSLQRNSGHIVGGVRKVGAVAGASFVFPVGSASGYSPATVNFDSGSGDFTVFATPATMAGLESNRALSRYWTLEPNGITQADITLEYPQSDVPAGSPEAVYYFHRDSGGVISTFLPSTSNTTTNVFKLNDVTQFSDWTLGEHSAPGCVAGQATWDGGGTTNNWSEAANWLCDAVPAASEPVFLNNRSVKPVNVDLSLDIGALTLDTGFTGTVSNGASNVVIGGDFVQRSGSFVGGAGNLDFNGRFDQTAGTFTASSGTTAIAGDFFRFGAFNHNSGTVVFDGTAALFVGVSSLTFNNLTISKAGVASVIGTPIVAGTLRLVDGTVDSGNFDTRGDVVIESGCDGGSAGITFSQAAVQNIVNNGGINPAGFWQLIKNGGTLQMNSDLDLSNGTSNLVLTTGTITTGPFVLDVGNRGVGRTAARVIGNLRRSFSTTGTKVFDVGTADGYSPVSVNVTAGTGALTVGAVQGNRPGMDGAQSAQRYWTLTESGDLTANITFSYLQTDVVGNEADYKLFKWIGSTSTLIPSTLNTTSNTIAANGISEFSDWTIGNLFIPTAAEATINGRVFDSNGLPIRGAVVTVTEPTGAIRSARTNAFGIFRFAGLETGVAYVVGASSKAFTFQSRIVFLTDNVTDLELVALE